MKTTPQVFQLVLAIGAAGLVASARADTKSDMHHRAQNKHTVREYVAPLSGTNIPVSVDRLGSIVSTATPVDIYRQSALDRSGAQTLAQFLKGRTF